MPSIRIAYLKLNLEIERVVEFFESFWLWRDWRELSLKRKLSCEALDEILSDCEVSRGGGEIPTKRFAMQFLFW